MIFSLTSIAQESTLKEGIKILSQNNLSPEGYEVFQCNNPTDQEKQLVLGLAIECNKLNLKKCIELCELDMGMKFEFYESEFDSLLLSNQVPKRSNLCSSNHISKVASNFLNNKCPINGSKKASFRDLEKLFAQTIQNPLLHMKDPINLCYERAFVLAQELIEKGYRPMLLEMRTLIDRDSFQFEFNGNKRSFRNHWVVKMDDDKGNSYLLDPQFAKKVYPQAEYIENALMDGVKGVDIEIQDYHYLSLNPKNVLDKTCIDIKSQELQRVVSLLKSNF
jgi:hypothetical protein